MDSGIIAMIALVLAFTISLVYGVAKHEVSRRKETRARAECEERRKEIRKEADRTLAERAAEESRRFDREFHKRQLDRFMATVEARAALWNLEDGRKKLGIKPDLADVPTAQMIEELKRRKAVSHSPVEAGEFVNVEFSRIDTINNVFSSFGIAGPAHVFVVKDE